MATMKMPCAVGSGSGIDEYSCKVAVQNSFGDGAYILPTLGLSKLDVANIQSSSSSGYIKLCNVSDWSTFAYTDLTAIQSTLEAGQSASAIDVSSYNAVNIGANGRTTGPTLTIKLYN